MYSNFALYQTYDSTWTYQNIFQIASYVGNTASTSPIIAVFGEGEAAGGSGGAWGSNFVGYASSVTGAVIGDETDCGGLISGGTAYCKVLVASGGFAAQNAIQIQANAGGALFNDGIVVSSTSRSPITGSLFRAVNTTAQYGVNFTGATFSTAELYLPSFQVGSTIASTNSVLRVRGSASGNPSISAVGVGGSPATDITLTINSLGTGGIAIGGGGIYSTAASGGHKGAATANFTTYYGAGVAGVSCSVGTVSAATMVVTGGIVTHC